MRRPTSTPRSATTSAKIGPGRAQYTLCCDDETGGIVDDLIAYYQDDDHVLLVPNAANTAEVVRRLRGRCPRRGRGRATSTATTPCWRCRARSSDEVLTAVGLPAGHDYMTFVEGGFSGAEGVGVVVCRTGYTGERGYELIVENAAAPALWDALMAAGEQYGIAACGLGARDTLRTEMGYPLHGQDISLDVTPNEARLGWAVGWGKDAFWGRDVLLAEKAPGSAAPAGRACAPPVAPSRARTWAVSLTPDVRVGEVTSGTFSPTLKQGIALALVRSGVNPDAELGVDVRGRPRCSPRSSCPSSTPRCARSEDPMSSPNVPDQPPTFRRPTAAERPWVWRLETVDGVGGHGHR